MHLAILIASSIAALAVTGFLYQMMGSVLDRRKINDYGRWVDQDNGDFIFASIQGRGGPTVVFESGVSASSLHWHALQQEISKTNRTFAYDRLGLGWSTPCRSERVPSQLADELHRALLLPHG